MSKINANVRLDFEVNFALNELEVRALDALVGYGLDPFLKAFYEKLGKAYMQPYEAGLKTLFEKVEGLRPAMAEMDEVRKAAIKAKEKFRQ